MPGWLVRGNQSEKTYCLTGECSPDFERCLTARAPVALLISARATAPLSQSYRAGERVPACEVVPDCETAGAAS
jgi:hypothetical protein